MNNLEEQRRELKLEKPPVYTIEVERHTLFWILGIPLAMVVLWYAGFVLLLVFAGLLLAAVLRGATNLVASRTGLGPRAAFWMVILSFTAVIGTACFLLAPQVIEQVAEISQLLPQSLHQLHNSLSEYQWGRYVTSALDRAVALSNAGEKFRSAATTFLETGAEFVFVLIVGFFVAIEPETYLNGTLKLFPPRFRGRASRIIKEVAHTVQWWVLGQLVPMVTLGAVTMLALWLLGIPLAFTLGLFTAIMLAVPYAGSIISGIPVALVALMQGPMDMVWAILLFMAIHMLEGYIVTPLAQRRAVRLPPALTVVAQLGMWSVAGILGMAVATPLTAAIMVLVKMMYLHEQPEH